MTLLDGHVELIPHALVSVFSVGMALAFLIADRESPTSRALALGLAFIGISIAINVVMGLSGLLPAFLIGWAAIPESIATVAILEWILRVRRTVPTRALQVEFGDRMLRIGQVSAVVYSVLAILLPEQRSEDFLAGLTNADVLSRPGFWLFFSPILVAGLMAIGAIILLLNRRPDLPEKMRVIAMLAAIPFMMAGFVLPLQLRAIAMVLGQVIFLIGAVQYHVLQGQRGQFMSQFLSPQVADLVRSQGLKRAMQEDFLEISVVYVDLRGYTAVAEGTASKRVIRVLREYYEVVGQVVSEFGGTIKDQAGDGMLILVGAPIAVPDHAQRALTMARRIRASAADLKRRWAQEGIWLGLGVGVATGHVTVGVIGSRSRLEYTAVGTPVNLAARLCQQSADGEVLVSERTVEIAGLQAAQMGIEVRTPLPMKGFSEPVGHFALAAQA